LFQSYLQLLAGFCQLVWVKKYEDVIAAAIERQAIVVCLKFEVLVEFSTHRGSVSDLVNLLNASINTICPLPVINLCHSSLWSDAPMLSCSSTGCSCLLLLTFGFRTNGDYFGEIHL